MTKTDVRTDVKTNTVFVTKTQTLPVTVTSLVTESKFSTKTDTVKETLTNVVTKTDIKVIPTTFTSVWVKTDIIDKVSFLDSSPESWCLQAAFRPIPSSALSRRLSPTRKR